MKTVLTCLLFLTAYGAVAATTNGTSLASPYDVDMDGVTRGGDGVWDIGAYEYAAGGGTVNSVRGAAMAQCTFRDQAFLRQFWVPPSPLPNVTNGLIAWWKLDDGTGSTCADSAGTNTGVIIGTPAWTNGVINGGLGFTGTQSMASTNSSSNLVAVTIALWVWPPNANANAYIVDYEGPGSTERRSLCSGFQDGYFNIYNSGWPTGNAADTQVPITESAWQHIAYCSDGSTIQAYKNGTRIVNVSGNLNQASVQTLIRIGSELNLGNFFPGNLDDIRIYNRALSSNEVQTVYQWRP